MFKIIKKLFSDSWNDDFLEELINKKFLTYTQIAAKDPLFKETPALYNQYIIDLDQSLNHFKKHIKMTYGDPDIFKDKYEAKNIELLNELFIIGEKCIEGYSKSEYKINTEWDVEIIKMFMDSVKEEMNDLLIENYIEIPESIRLLLSLGIADCFYKTIHNRFPNFVIFRENFFTDGIDPYIQEYINQTKFKCMNEVLDIHEKNIQEEKDKQLLKESLKKEILEEIKS
jgi:hypothetical protein